MSRFQESEVDDLLYLLRVPATIRLPNRALVPGKLGLMVLLRRLAYPNRLGDLVNFFGLPEGALSMTVSWVFFDDLSRVSVV